MFNRQLVGSALCLVLVVPVFGHDRSASPTPTPAVYRNPVANTYSGTSPNSSLKAPAANSSPSKNLVPKAVSGTLSTSSPAAFMKSLPSPSPAPVNSVGSRLTKLAKTVPVSSPNPDDIVGPPAPTSLVKTTASPPAKLLKADASPPAKLGKVVASPSPELVKAITSSGIVKQPSNGAKLAPAPPPSSPAGPAPTPEPDVRIVVSVRDQKLAVVVNGKIYRTYKISTSRYGEGDNFGSWQTPLGHLQVATKIGGAAPPGSVFHRRQQTGEILAANSPGRDPIVSRIIWLRGTEAENKRAFQRCIYIHGTPQEEFLGKKASYGCIRMRSSDVIEVFNWVGIGTNVAIVQQPIRRAVKDIRTESIMARNDQTRQSEPTGNPSEANR
jgi:lipoprotein-anchoring transpeptidase ErfK/SrfK